MTGQILSAKGEIALPKTATALDDDNLNHYPHNSNFFFFCLDIFSQQDSAPGALVA